MSTASFALLAAITAVLATATATVIVLRSRRASERRLTAGMLEVETRMEALVQELTATVARVREDALRARVVESFGQTLDFDEVLARSVDAAASLQGVVGASAAVYVDDEQRVVATAGDAVTGERSTRAVGGPPDGRAVRAVGISYHYATGAAGDDALRSAIAVPLESGSEHLGFLTVFGRSEEPPVAGNDFATLEAIAQHAGPALAEARRRGGERPVPEADPLTGLGSRLALHETLAVEVARALRHDTRLAVCTFDLDDFRQTNARIGQIEGDAVLQAVADLIRASLRPGDIAYRSGGDEFAVILPGSGRIEGEALYARLQASLGRTVEAPGAGVSLSAGIAELKADDDGVSLYERAERALHRAKAAGKGTAA